jgi:hypothetical protein
VAAACGFLISFAITFQSIGLSQGLNIGDKEFEEYLRRIELDQISFTVFGGTCAAYCSVSGGPCGEYCYLSSIYAIICFLFTVILVASLLWTCSRNTRTMPIVFMPTMIALALMLYNLQFLLRTKLIEESFFRGIPRNAFAELTITYDWVFISLAVFLFGLHAVSVILWIKDAKKITPY